jgi:hypothetical protein
MEDGNKNLSTSIGAVAVPAETSPTLSRADGVRHSTNYSLPLDMKPEKDILYMLKGLDQSRKDTWSTLLERT